MAYGSVLGNCHSDQPSECSCCDHAYDAGRLAATLWLAQDLLMPHGWDLKEALENPVSQLWLQEHFLPTLHQIRNTGAPEWRNYPIRQAALVIAVMQHATWSARTRKAAAWALLRAGMIYHNWEINPSAQEATLLTTPPNDFWERFDDVRLLSELLDRTYDYRGPS